MQMRWSCITSAASAKLKPSLIIATGTGSMRKHMVP